MGTSCSGRGLAVSALLVASLAATACAGAGAGGSPTTSVERSTTTSGSASLTKREFAAEADQICLETASHFSELPEPVGGAKPIGLGGFMRDWVADLRELHPPPDIAADWVAGLDLLDRAADELDAAEAGDPEAQSKALWGLEPRAQQHFNAMHVPFRVCFAE